MVRHRLLGDRLIGLANGRVGRLKGVEAFGQGRVGIDGSGDPVHPGIIQLTVDESDQGFAIADGLSWASIALRPRARRLVSVPIGTSMTLEASL